MPVIVPRQKGMQTDGKQILCIRIKDSLLTSSTLCPWEPSGYANENLRRKEGKMAAIIYIVRIC